MAKITDGTSNLPSSQIQSHTGFDTHISSADRNKTHPTEIKRQSPSTSPATDDDVPATDETVAEKDGVHSPEEAYPHWVHPKFIVLAGGAALPPDDVGFEAELSGAPPRRRRREMFAEQPLLLGKRLKHLAAELGFRSGSYDLRSNLGGDAVSGERSRCIMTLLRGVS